MMTTVMKTGDMAKVSPELTGLDNWVEGKVINIEKNPFKGIVVAIKDEAGKIFFGEERYFEQINKNLCLQ